MTDTAAANRHYQNVAGVISRSIAVPGVYTVKPDCTGSKTFGGATDYDFVVTPDGHDIYWIVTNANSGALFTGRAVRLDNSAELHVTKDCSAYTGAAGAYCTITSSNLAAIKVGAKVFYDQAANISPGLLDSDVVLDAGNANRAFSRCLVDSNTGLGLSGSLPAGPDNSPGSVPVSMSRRLQEQPIISTGMGRTASIRRLSDIRSFLRRRGPQPTLTESGCGKVPLDRASLERVDITSRTGSAYSFEHRAPGRPAISCSERNPPGGIAGISCPAAAERYKSGHREPAQRRSTESRHCSTTAATCCRR